MFGAFCAVTGLTLINCAWILWRKMQGANTAQRTAFDRAIWLLWLCLGVYGVCALVFKMAAFFWGCGL